MSASIAKASRKIARLAFSISAFATASLAAGCFTLVDVDGFHQKTAKTDAAGPVTTGNNGSRQHLDLRFTAASMRPHSGHLFEYRVIDANNFIQSRGIIRAMTNGDTVINVPRAVPRANGPHRLDFYADVNHSGGYDGVGSVLTNDHAWRIEPLQNFPEGSVTPVEGVVQVNFVHDTSFTNIDDFPNGTKNAPKDTGLPARLRMSGLDAYVGKLVQIRVADTATGHVVGLFRHTVLDLPTIDETIPGAVDVDTEYTLDVFVDANGNGQYDNPASSAGDLGFRFATASTATGLDVVTNLVASEGKVDVGPP